MWKTDNETNMGNICTFILDGLRTLYRKYVHYELRRNRNWNRLLQDITTPQQYREVIDGLFSDDIITNCRLLILECFTRDLCAAHATQSFWEEFLRFKEKKA